MRIAITVPVTLYAGIEVEADNELDAFEAAGEKFVDGLRLFFADPDVDFNWMYDAELEYKVEED